jgi:Domain of unknown function (DUF4262)
MCWQCDHPGANWQDYLAHLRELLDRHCWVVQGVQRQRQRPPYAYTIGLAAHDRPELVVTGLPYDRAADLLNDIAEQVIDADTAPAPGDRVALPGGIVAEVVRVAEPGVHLAVAAALNGPAFAAVQLVYTDDEGRWPWEADFRGGRGGQPVLGGRSELSRRADGRPGPDAPGVPSTA